jgi:hypothetical protein
MFPRQGHSGVKYESVSPKAHTSFQDAARELHPTPVPVTSVEQLHDVALQTGNENRFHVRTLLPFSYES